MTSSLDGMELTFSSTNNFKMIYLLSLFIKSKWPTAYPTVYPNNYSPKALEVTESEWLLSPLGNTKSEVQLGKRKYK